MNYKELIEELEELEENIDKNENELDFTMLKMLQSVLKAKDEKEKNEQHRQMEQEVNEMIDSIIDRPSDYFETKERNIQKMIEKSKFKKALPQNDRDKEVVNNQATINTIVKLLDKAIQGTSSQEIKFQLDDVKKNIKNINTKREKAHVKQQIKKANITIKLILQKELQKEQDTAIGQ